MTNLDGPGNRSTIIAVTGRRGSPLLDIRGPAGIFAVKCLNEYVAVQARGNNSRGTAILFSANDGQFNVNRSASFFLWAVSLSVANAVRLRATTNSRVENTRRDVRRNGGIQRVGQTRGRLIKPYDQCRGYVGRGVPRMVIRWKLYRRPNAMDTRKYQNERSRRVVRGAQR